MKNQYAPVVILVLDRYKHFKSCLESLEKCIWAEYTDVYIALDYPPSNEYIAGWLMVSEYLEKKVQSNIFNNLILCKRDRNFGMGFPDGNLSTIVSSLQYKYDSYILLEDDNILSPNFLVYINKGLNKFKNDDRITLVCGYNYPMDFPKSYKNNFYISKYSSSWGYATWFSKEEKIKKYYNLEFLKDILRDNEKFARLMKIKPSTVYSIINMIKNNTIYLDSAIGCYLGLEDKYCVFPTISKVKNIGSDGSGVNSTSIYEKQMNYYQNQTVDVLEEFEFSDDIFTYEPVMLVRYSSPKPVFKELYKGLVGRIDLFLFRHFNFVPRSKYI